MRAPAQAPAAVPARVRKGPHAPFRQPPPSASPGSWRTSAQCCKRTRGCTRSRRSRLPHMRSAHACAASLSLVSALSSLFSPHPLSCTYPISCILPRTNRPRAHTQHPAPARVIGTVNGISQTAAAFASTIAPTLAGSAFSWWVSVGVCAYFWCVSVGAFHLCALHVLRRVTFSA